MFVLLEGTTPDGPRRGRLTTAHGVVDTPVFMPVGTQGTVKALTPRDLTETGADILLGNTYHLTVRPGIDVVQHAGGLHQFIGWNRAILTDSGGYQIFSLAKRNRVTDDGVTFQSHIDGTEFTMTPESTVATQDALGTDIAMCLDECPAYTDDKSVVAQAVERTTAWARRARETAHRESMALFGIVQGGVFPDLREESAAALVDLDFPGYALGGFSVGEPGEALWQCVSITTRALPVDKPRYLMGMGHPEDILDAVGRGIDMFDCVLPTRNARNGMLFTSAGPRQIRHARYREDFTPVDSACGCYTCRTFSRAYLRHLHLAGEILASQLCSLHNIAFYQTLLRDCRTAIEAGRFAAFAAERRAALTATNGPSDTP